MADVSEVGAGDDATGPGVSWSAWAAAGGAGDVRGEVRGRWGRAVLREGMR